MMEAAKAAGQKIDTAALAELLEQTRPKPGQGLNDPLPDWYVVAECMRTYHWTEKQFWEENSMAMIFRLLFVEKVHAEREEKDQKKGQSGGNFPQVPTGRQAMGSAGGRRPPPRR